MNHFIQNLPRISTLVLVLVFGLILGRCFTPLAKTAGDKASASGHQHETAAEVWTCSMHPTVQAPKPGDCPICGMDLIPLVLEKGGAGNGPRAIRLDDGQKALAGIQTEAVRRAEAIQEVHLVGKLAIDETAIATLSAYVGGRLDRLYVDYTGLKVRAGDHLAEIYSPQLFHAQQELIVAVESAKRFGAQSDESLIKISHSTVVAARKKLTLYGITEEQMQQIVNLGEPSEQITLSAPMGGTVIHRSAVEGQYVKEGDPLYTIANLDQLWLELDAYESNLPWVRYGQEVMFSVDAWPGEVFNGTISFLDPVLDPTTRTVHVRVEVDNRDGRLRPEMYARATVRTRIVGDGVAAPVDMSNQWLCPMHPEVFDGVEGACRICGMPLETAESLGYITDVDQTIAPLLIPVTAPLLTGDRAVVFVAIPDVEQHDATIFEARDVVLGPRAESYFVVKSGLREGERVVSRGAFIIDSELQLRGKDSMMAPKALEAKLEREESSVMFREHNGRLLVQLASLGENLASDDFPAAQGNVEKLQDLLSMMLSDMAPKSARASLGKMNSALKPGSASDIRGLRVAFEKLHTPSVNLADRFGYIGVERELAIFHCPMAFDDVGANWIDFAGDGTRNPYFGASMLKCGTETQTVSGFNQQ